MAYRVCNRTEDGFIDESSCYVPFWYTKTGIIVKWSLFLGLITSIGLYLLFGYLHAQKRIKKGLRPLAYHRFLVSRRQMATVDPAYQYPQAEARPYFYNQQYFGMQNMPPPPVYDPTASRPPNYPGPPAGGPPDGASKVDPSQQNGPEYQPPVGPPPGAVQPNNTGSNPFRL